MCAEGWGAAGLEEELGWEGAGLREELGWGEAGFREELDLARGGAGLGKGGKEGLLTPLCKGGETNPSSAPSTPLPLIPKRNRLVC